MPNIHILAGPARSGKTGRLLQLYRSALPSAPLGSVVWLAPTAFACTHLRADLLESSCTGCFSPGITTFLRFSDAIIQASSAVVRPISRLAKRYLLRGVIQTLNDAGKLPHFGPIAATAGLLDLVDDVISEMKRLEVWPEHWTAACERRGMTAKDAELLAIYSAYQERLHEHQLYDAEGRSWLARDLLGNAACGLAKSAKPQAAERQTSRWQLVVVDGFSDFTRTEHDILASLAQQAEEMWITLPLDESQAATAARNDLYRKPLRTLEELQRRHANLHIEFQKRLTADHRLPTTDHLERSLFANPRLAKPVPPTTDLVQSPSDHRPPTSGIEFIVAGRQIGEIERVGCRVKQLLADGVPATDIAVVFRRPADVADLVREVFNSLGIPFTLQEGEPLTRGPAVAMLLKLLQLDADDWPLRSLLAVVGNFYFRPDWLGWADDRLRFRVELALRSLQIVRGREMMLGQLSRSIAAAVDTVDSANDESDAALDRELTERAADRETASDVLRPLAALFDSLPRRATLDDWSQAWERLAERVGIFRAVESLPPGDRATDAAAWRKFRESILDSCELARWLPQDSPFLDRAAAIATLHDLLAGQTFEIASPVSGNAGCVRVLAPAAARHLRVPHLFLAGLTEKSFPLADREDRLYGEAERLRLVEAGLPLVTRDDRQGEEMLLFYEVVTAATERLYLSYPGLDEKGEPLSPSPFLKEVEQACGGTTIKRTEYLELSPVRRDEEPMTQAAFRIRAVADALDGKLGLLAGLIAHNGPGARGVVDGLRLHAMRQDRKTFTAAEGMLSERVRDDFAHRFASQRIYSATELERYASCPFRYFLTDVLGAKVVDESALEVDVAERGRKAHLLFYELHRQINNEAGGPKSLALLSADEYRVLADKAIEQVAAVHERESLAGALAEIDRRMLVQWAEAYYEHYKEYDKQAGELETPPRPELFEISFGRRLRPGDAAPSTSEPLVLTHGDQVVRLSGRVDRIDLGQAGKYAIFNIVDYKTGSSARFSPEAVERGTLLQLPLYALATAELILNDRDAMPWQAGYWHLAGDGFKPKQALQMYQSVGGPLEPTEPWEVIREMLPATVVSLVTAMRAGQFPVYNADPNCTGHCPFRTVCRIHQIRSLEKTWQLPNL